MGYNNLGVGYRFDGQDKKAKEAFEKALVLDPKAAIPLSNLGVFLFGFRRENKGSRILPQIYCFYRRERRRSRRGANSFLYNSRDT